MSDFDETWGYAQGGGGGSIGPAGRPKPLPIDELSLVPGKGNLGGPSNQAANDGAGVEPELTG